MATLPYRPRHKEPMRSDEYLDLETADFNAFLAGDTVKLRGGHHQRAAESVILAYEAGERARRSHLKSLVTSVTTPEPEMKAAA